MIYLGVFLVGFVTGYSYARLLQRKVNKVISKELKEMHEILNSKLKP